MMIGKQLEYAVYCVSIGSKNRSLHQRLNYHEHNPWLREALPPLNSWKKPALEFVYSIFG